MNLILIFVVVWFLLSVLASNIGSKKGYFGWLFFLASCLSTLGVIVLSVRGHHLESVAPMAAWICPLLVTGVAAVLPARE